MLRKIALAAVAAVALGAATLPSTEASARWHGGGGWHGGGWHHGWHGGGWHRGWGGPRFYAFGPRWGAGCWRVRRVWTPWGPRLRRVNVCF